MPFGVSPAGRDDRSTHFCPIEVEAEKGVHGGDRGRRLRQCVGPSFMWGLRRTEAICQRESWDVLELGGRAGGRRELVSGVQRRAMFRAHIKPRRRSKSGGN